MNDSDIHFTVKKFITDMRQREQEEIFKLEVQHYLISFYCWYSSDDLTWTLCSAIRAPSCLPAPAFTPLADS